MTVQMSSGWVQYGASGEDRLSARANSGVVLDSLMYAGVLAAITSTCHLCTQTSSASACSPQRSHTRHVLQGVGAASAPPLALCK